MGLQKAVENALAGIGFQPEERAYHPHVSFARLKDGRTQEVRSFLESLRGLQLPAAQVSRFVLFKSELRPEWAVHTIVETYPLR
jgi:2'-5' RNA ligase